MKEKHIAYIVMAFIGLFMIGFSLLVTVNRSNKLARMQEEQAALPDVWAFILPDGSIYIPAEELDGDDVQITVTRKP